MAAWQEAIIGSETGGFRLNEVRVNVGDMVKKGQVLAVFSADSVNADVAQARAALLETQRQRRRGGRQRRARAHAANLGRAVSAQQISQYMTAEQTANARIAASQATLAAQQLRLKYTQVVAPDSGVISARTATVGSVVASAPSCSA